MDPLASIECALPIIKKIILDTFKEPKKLYYEGKNWQHEFNQMKENGVLEKACLLKELNFSGFEYVTEINAHHSSEIFVITRKYANAFAKLTASSTDITFTLLSDFSMTKVIISNPANISLGNLHELLKITDYINGKSDKWCALIEDKITEFKLEDNVEFTITKYL